MGSHYVILSYKNYIIGPVVTIQTLTIEIYIGTAFHKLCFDVLLQVLLYNFYMII
jgi:hypothetical protein